MSHQSDLIEKDIMAYLKEHEEKELLRFITCGSVDDGKSTLIGRLLHDSKLIFEDQLESIKKDSKYKGSSDDNLDLALIVDGLQAEREQGITIDVAYRYFSTKKRKFIIADTPGHEQYTRNMATGASNAELAVILMDASKGVLPQTKRHTFITRLLGIKYLLVAVNKMDIVDYSEDVFKQIQKDYMDLLSQIESGQEKPEVVFVPISALKGDNVVNLSDRTPWYEGVSLLHNLENIKVDANINFKDFRFPVQYVNRPHSSFRGYSGMVASGTIKAGERVTVLPSRKESVVKEVVPAYHSESEKNDSLQTMEVAWPPMSITLTLEDELDISRGDMIVKSENIPDVSDSFYAMVIWMNENPLVKNRQYDIKRASTYTSGYVEEILYKVDVNTLQKKDADSLKLNEIGYCKINLTSQIAYDKYVDHKQTGSFIFIDRLTNVTSGAGLIKDKAESRNVVWHETNVSKEERIAIKGHSPCVLWFTGLSGAGKSTIAGAVESYLNQNGVHTYLLDGDNVRHGLNKDLGFSEADREENIRRIGEVAKLFLDAGVIVLTSFISPFRRDRDNVRNIVNDDEFVEVFVDTPLDVCEKRDPKGLYKRARAGEIKEFTGVDSPYEEPLAPEIHLETEDLSVDKAVEKVIVYLKNAGIINL